MRTRRWLTLVIFAVCALAVLEGLGWVTYQTLRLERGELAARADARFQESIRLALWRMENVLSPILAQESARPYFHYSPFYPAERAYTRMWHPVEPGEVLVPSPLLEGAGQYVRLHFQLGPDGRLTSPQAPTDEMRSLAESAYVDSEFIVYAAQRLAELGAMLQSQASGPPWVGRPRAAAGEPGAPGLDAEPGQYADEFRARREAAQLAQNINEPFTKRAPRPAAEAPADGYARDRDAAPGANGDLGAQAEQTRTLVAAPEGHTEVEQGAFDAVWLDAGEGAEPELVLVRSVWIQGQRTLQGVWLDWPALRARLLQTVQDLLPGAALVPLEAGERPAQPLMLAAIPARLIPGDPPPAAGPGFTPTHSTLVVTWLAVLAAVAAIGLVLRASMDLSDRRGRFVSAVTHELRTPLTTFCLYTDLLAGGAVRDEEAQREYLGVLKDESQRLARIVDNVLAYARLGERRAVTRPAPIEAAALLDEVRPALARRAQQDGMELAYRADHLDGATVRADAQTVERILLNLVDNACKYAGEAADRRLHLDASAAEGRLEVRFSDHGPGIPKREQARVFQAFHRARRDAEGPKAGLGLGLALAKALAHELGGDLELVPTRRTGAHFRLTIPLVGRAR